MTPKQQRIEVITIGEYTLDKRNLHSGSNKLWIEHESGEGGEFNESDLTKVIGEFYAKNF